ncbi:MAG: hypothetical protein JSW39_16160 [Desulfobacterales bacterium]|nr:MAG: hypothetical protein JSW39_16160 [Desulfobacterales bacterium]
MAKTRGKKIQTTPDLKLHDVWKRYIREPSAQSDEHHQVVYRSIRQFDADARQGILDELSQIENQSLHQNNRLRYIREKIMDLVDRKISATYLRQLSGNNGQDANPPETEATEKSLDLALTDCEIQIAILRAYAAQKYGDHHPDDWFAFYARLSAYFYGRMVGKQEGAGARDSSFKGWTLAPTGENFQRLREECLDAYVGQEFELPAGAKRRFQTLRRTFKWQSIRKKLIS